MFVLQIILQFYIYFLKGVCENLHITNLKTSKTRDIAKWTLGVQFGKWSENSTSTTSKKCGNGKSWFGWNEVTDLGTNEGTIKAKFACNGTGTLNFGNCGTGGSVKVYIEVYKEYDYIEDIEIGSANESSTNNIITFEFKSGNALKLQQKGPGSIILFNDFHAHPTGILMLADISAFVNK